MTSRARTLKVGDRMRWFHTRKTEHSGIEISYMVTIKEIKPEWVVVTFDDPYLGESNVDLVDLERPYWRAAVSSLLIR